MFLLSNGVLGKNLLFGDLLEKYTDRQSVQPIRPFDLFNKICLAYLKNAVWLGIYLAKRLAFAFSRYRCQIPSVKEEVIIIDTYFYMKEIIRNGRYLEKYFRGLDAVLRKKNRVYLFTPFFYGSYSPYTLYQTLRILKKERIQVLTEFQLIRGRDYLLLCYFMLAYPIRVLLFVESMTDQSYESRLIRNELLHELDQLSIESYSRYLYGRRISETPLRKIKCISWFENQTIDKNFYRGLRYRTGKVSVYGAQLLVWSKTMLHFKADEREEEFGTVPDVIVVNGPFYMPGRRSRRYRIGPSLRYEKLFQTKITAHTNHHYLVLLSYLKYEIENVLTMVGRIDVERLKGWIKFHPSTRVNYFKKLVPGKFAVARADLYSLFKQARIVIGSETGSLVEAASVGIPVIQINNKRKFSHNPFPEYGRGLIWHQADSSTELALKIETVENLVKIRYKDIVDISRVYRSMFFSEPTEQRIMDAFDIN